MTSNFMKPKWKLLAGSIVRQQSEGFDWRAYESRIEEIQTRPEVLHLDSQLRSMHSQFVRICLAYVRLAESDLAEARRMWVGAVPDGFGMMEFLDPDWERTLPESPLYAHLATGGRLSAELWFQIARQVRGGQDSAAILDFLKRSNAAPASTSNGHVAVAPCQRVARVAGADGRRD